MYSCFSDAVYKATKISANGHDKSKARATAEDDGEDDYYLDAGPELPQDEEEQLPEDDEEGRFFGGGLTKNTADVMDFIDEQDNSETVRWDTRFDEMEARLMARYRNPRESI